MRPRPTGFLPLLSPQIGGQDDHDRPVAVVRESSAELDAAAVIAFHVDQHDVGAMLRHPSHRLIGVAGGPNHLQVG